MTKEEAIRILDPKTRRETMRQIPVFERIEADQEACRVALSTLRAQQSVKLDRSRWEGCDYCTAGDSEFRYLLDKWGEDYYCPRCGRPLTEEAWAELERRIGGDDETD